MAELNMTRLATAITLVGIVPGSRVIAKLQPHGVEFLDSIANHKCEDVLVPACYEGDGNSKKEGMTELDFDKLNNTLIITGIEQAELPVVTVQSVDAGTECKYGYPDEISTTKIYEHCIEIKVFFCYEGTVRVMVGADNYLCESLFFEIDGKKKIIQTEIKLEPRVVNPANEIRLRREDTLGREPVTQDDFTFLLHNQNEERHQTMKRLILASSTQRAVELKLLEERHQQERENLLTRLSG